MESKISINGSYQQVKSISNVKTNTKVEFTYEVKVKTNDTVTIEKFGGYVVSTNHLENELISAAEKVLRTSE